MRKVLKWFRPGLRIKRWILVIFLGIVFGFLATGFVALFFFTPRDEPHGEFLFFAALGFLLSAFCLITGIYRLMKSMWSLVHRRGDTRDWVDVALERAQRSRGPKVVAIGGGTGLSVVLSGMRTLSHDITAIVSMADDGGSSGKLRQELGLQPPGDLRKCLIALADEEPLMSEVLDFRFPEHELGGHNFGNLFLTVLARIRGDFGAGIREANRILSVAGRVLPSTLDRIFLVANHEDGTKTTGQAEIAKTEKRIKKLEIKPKPEPVAEDIRRALEEAELIVLGPGSLYTSVLPNLLIEGMPEALARSPAKKVFVANIMTYEGETKGFHLPDLLRTIDEHTKPFQVYTHVLVNNGFFEGKGDDPWKPPLQIKEAQPSPDRYPSARLVKFEPKEFQHAPFKLVARDVVNPAFPIRHDSKKLAQALMEILKEP